VVTFVEAVMADTLMEGVRRARERLRCLEDVLDGRGEEVVAVLGEARAREALAEITAALDRLLEPLADRRYPRRG
jgi:hypothetical protein